MIIARKRKAVAEAVAVEKEEEVRKHSYFGFSLRLLTNKSGLV
jgi:hypothetical protein